MNWQQRWADAMMENYGTPPVMLSRGRGSRVWDVDDNEYLDLIAGIAVNALGHADPRIAEAVNRQLATLGHVSNLFATEPGMALAERLIEIVGEPSARVFFCNSGAEANEAAFKMTRLTGRPKVVVAEGSFHGRTMGSLALTAQPGKADPFRPLPGEVITVPFGDSAALLDAVDSDTAAVFLEPIQGEAGVVVPPSGYLRNARDITSNAGALLVVDEVQTGIGRTGEWFAYRAEEIVPDVVTLAKGLGGGIPIGAVIGIGDAATLLQPGMHGSTFGGNPVSASAALAVLDAIEEDGLRQRAVELGERLAAGVMESAGGLVTEVRGRGLLRAAALANKPSADVERELRSRGVLANPVSPQAIRMAPALTITDDDIEQAIKVWGSIA
ncbi:acetylornithine transaminase [Candidatus Nanopelagicales bacterium]|nr:acetylornithine transaminase [Candidatus Nanopelagicales bacterium]